MPRTVTDRDRTAKIFFSPLVVVSGSLSVRIFIILSQAFECRDFRKFEIPSANLLVGFDLSGESKPNSRMTKMKTIGVMFMVCSIIGKKSPGRERRAELRATGSKRRTRRKRSNRRWLNSSSRYFLKRSKTDISRNVKFFSER